jgi:glycosyltransferase involved in cell wall biosynthesis
MISVITPVFNGERFIEECIQTVIRQAHPNVEHIIVDGDSQDRTVEIIKNYALNYPHIRWISENDNGQSDALNKGVAMARGDILGILNVDDYYEPNVLKRVSAMFETLPMPSLLVGNCNVWNDDGNLRYVNKPSKLKLTDLLLGWHVNPHPVNPSAYFYHKVLHDEIGPYRQDMQIGQDLPFLLSAVQVANVKYVDELWGNWRRIEGTLTVTDSRAGLATTRMKMIMRSYLKDLPLIKQWHIITLRPFYRRYNIEKRRFTKVLKMIV